MWRDSFEKQTKKTLPIVIRVGNPKHVLTNFLPLTNFTHFYARPIRDLYIRDMSSSSSSSLAVALLLAKKVGLHDQSSFSFVRLLRSCRTETGDDEMQKQQRASGRMKLFECVELVDAAANSVKSRSGMMNTATKKNAKEDFVDEENDDVIDERHKVRKLNTFGDDTERQRMMENDFCLYAGGAVESLDWLDDDIIDEGEKSASLSSSRAFLAVEAREDSKNARVKIKDAFARKGEFGVVQVYRCASSSSAAAASSPMKMHLECLIEHDGGFAHCVRWLPNLPMKKKVKEKKKERDKEKTTTINKKESKVDAENEVEIKIEYEIEASRSVLDAKVNNMKMKDIEDARKDILGYLAACLADGSVQVWAVPNAKKKDSNKKETNIKVLKAENVCIFRGALVTKNPLRGGLSLSWSQGAPGRLAVGTVDGSVCVFDIHRCMQYDIENNVSYSKSSNEKHFAHVPTITVTMEEAGPIRDLEFAPLEDEDENREDEKSVEDDIKRKRLASANFIAVAAHKVSKANVIDLRSRSVLPESFQIEKWMDDIRSVAWLPKGAYIYGCDGTVGFNGKFLLRQYDGPICWEDDEQEVRYGGTVGIKLPAADDILKDIKNATSKDAIDYTKKSGGMPWSIDSRIFGTRGSRNKCSFVVVGSNSGVLSASVQRYRMKESKNKDTLWKAQGGWSAFEQIGGMREVRVKKERFVEFRTPGDDDIVLKKEGGEAQEDDDEEGFRTRKGLECHEVRVNRTGNTVWIASGFVNGFVRVQSLERAYLDKICDIQSDEMDKWLHKEPFGS